jgi:hypothetical protein
MRLCWLRAIALGRLLKSLWGRARQIVRRLLWPLRSRARARAWAAYLERTCRQTLLEAWAAKERGDDRLALLLAHQCQSVATEGTLFAVRELMLQLCKETQANK